MSDRRSFRWQSLFQNAVDPLFVLDNRRRLRFVNPAFEALTGVSAERLRGLPCRSRSAPGSDALAEDVIAHALTPPREVLAGAFGRTRRLVHDRSGRTPAAPPTWWDVEFLPFSQGDDGRLVLGRVVPVPSDAAPAAVLLPERLVALRQSVVGRHGYELLQSKHPGMVRIATQVRLAMEVRSPVLFLGEAGTGKRSLARLVHYQGRQRESAFALLDCERLPAEVLGEMLLGVSSSRNGVGTIYLHEPSELPRELQQMLAQRLATEDRSGPRLLAGTTRTIADSVAEGRLLVELAGLLSPIVIEVPPLCRRMDDLSVLVERMLARLHASNSEPVPSLTPAAWDLLKNYRWPGNLTELFAVLSESRKRASGGRIDAGDLPMILRLAQEPGPAPKQQPPLPELLEQVERRLIAVALRRADGNRSKAADLLGIYRSKLLRRMEALGLADLPEVTGES